jgi:putative peptidoglycan lipid II flippase
MTGSGDWAQRQAHDPDETVVMPAVSGSTSGSHDDTDVFPAVSLNSGRSIGYQYDAAGVTAEQPIIRLRPPGERSGRHASPEPALAPDGHTAHWPGGLGAAGVGDALAEPPPTPLPPDGGETSVVRHGAVMAVGSIASRVTGFLRTATIGAAIGAYAVGNDYTLANTLPGMVYELLLGGVLASVVIPLLVRARTRDADRGEAYTQRLLTLAVVFLAGATLLAVLFAPVFTALLTGGSTPDADKHLITTLSFLLLPMIFFYGMAALFAGVLNTRGHFAMPTFTPILNNLVVIAVMTTFLFAPVADIRSAARLSGMQIAILGLGTTLGIVVQAVGLWPALRRVEFRWRWRWDFRQLHLRELGRVSSWMLAYVVISQVGLLVVLKLAYAASVRGENAAGPNIFYNAFLIFMMAHGIVAVSIITALMPRMAAAAAEHRGADLVAQLSLGTRLTAVVLVPATAAYVVLGQPLAYTLFRYGHYSVQAAHATGWVIAVAGLGLVPFAISQLQLFAFYAMPDTKTPALVNLPVVAVRIVVDLLLFVILPATWVAAGLMGGNTISFVLAAMLGYWLLRRRVGALGLSAILSTIGRLAAAAVVASIPTLLFVLGVGAMMTESHLSNLVQLLGGGIILITVYVATAFALKVREVRDLAGMLRTRLGR